ncbi:putative bifunctional diguanylate cyclase/phosphodiesterase [Mesorhizobium amorphae]|uniref:Sensory box/GGDEF family protein n=1 Tax=Mesorhizobium amorphae CCNWGS0123 TaxID=1082933 RepID=G6YGQ4_9HYPH|nr:bifunctional diguanylate cyclase/phosphodiesterase [Mesorhizobium amorphae]ANT52513.1 diguanylate cyclase [Mesorhizobium amorphae CCNWGS0123]EHH08434.1 sensory box/GGDEF family protein [Mesorhizobium amorphae CCNWGS0123]GLR43750.1 bifunctional diguanylate cyclase/phosphodiesterase [Mesorhizobium amorphae]
MMRVISCVTMEHNLWLVLVAALVCSAGSWATIRLFLRAHEATGLQQIGWHFLTAVSAGSSIWCTHFVAMLAYDPGAPIAFDPVLTIASLFLAMAGTAAGFIAATGHAPRIAPIVGGIILGLAISGMHYTGMAAYHVDGIVEWDTTYVVVSVVLSVLFSCLAINVALNDRISGHKYLAAAILVAAIVSLHFTAMAAMQVTPLALHGDYTNPAALRAMALGVAVAGLIVIGTGLASYLIDDRTRSEAFRRLHHLAMNDTLTGLPNRANFNEYLDREIDRARELGGKVAIIGIDLDRFKEINDLWGHGAGDLALKTLAGRMSALLQDGEFVARLGGDEFAAIKRMKGQADLLDFVSRLEAALFAPIRIDDFEAAAGASLGVAIYPTDAHNRETLVNNADLAMYRAKANVTQTVCFYEQAMDEAVRANRALANDLREAVENGQLDLHYQVQTSVSTGDIRGYEALLRWKHPTRGNIPPIEFIPLAEENGLILPLGEWVLRTACAKAASWEHPYKVAVNLSPVQFAHADLPKLVHEILLETGLRPNRLELEITESTIIADKNRTLTILRRIKALGVTIAIDDFGTGYSSLETLRAFPFDKIKLDRSFMSEVETSPQAKAIIRAVLALGQSLHIPVLAEGVETHSQLSILRAEGCNEAQGYLLGRPAPFGEIFALMHGHNGIAATALAAPAQAVA